jgi:hypothetical protein
MDGIYVWLDVHKRRHSLQNVKISMYVPWNISTDLQRRIHETVCPRDIDQAGVIPIVYTIGLGRLCPCH